MSWTERRARLGTLISVHGDEEAEAAAVDRLLHGQSVIGQTSRTREIEKLRFSDKDLNLIGTLEQGQFGVIHLVNCKLDGKVYVRKSMEKTFALRNRDHCSPMTERDILLQATREKTAWAPHLFCAFQSETHLNLMMSYAEGGSLQDVLESSPLGGRLTEEDICWWAPQTIAAVEWCHRQGYAHRDIKPGNFVLTAAAHLQLIDFGSAAPLLDPDSDGVRRLPKEHCVVPCGTCDYIAPEILRAHERALVRLEMEGEADETTFHTRIEISLSEDDEDDDSEGGERGYGAEVDWWSVGVMLYEMAYGVTPFFAPSVQTTYLRIMDHKTSLRFDHDASISKGLKKLLKGLLTTATLRAGRKGSHKLHDYEFFDRISWAGLHELPTPTNLHRPEFAYDTPLHAIGEDFTRGESEAGGTSSGPAYQWSALFQSSPTSGTAQSGGLGSIVQNTPGFKAVLQTPSLLRSARSVTRDPLASFIGFSWGPPRNIELADASEEIENMQGPHANHTVLATPRPLYRHAQGQATPMSTLRATAGRQMLATPVPLRSAYATPMRTWGGSPAIPNTVLRGILQAGSSRKRRTVTDREAMKQMIDCVGMSARKRVLASGRKPRVLASELFRAGPLSGSANTRRTRSRSGSLGTLSSLSFRLDKSAASASDASGWSRVQGRRVSVSPSLGVRKELRFDETPQIADTRRRASLVSNSSEGLPDVHATEMTETETETETDLVSAPPSPSPTPRPGSALSILSASRRSVTPTSTLTGSGTASGTFGSALVRPPTAMSIFGFRDDDGRLSPSLHVQENKADTFTLSPNTSGIEQPDMLHARPSSVSAPASRTEHRENAHRRVADVTGYDDARAEANLLWDEMDARYHQLLSNIESLQTRLSKLVV